MYVFNGTYLTYLLDLYFIPALLGILLLFSINDSLMAHQPISDLQMKHEFLNGKFADGLFSSTPLECTRLF